MIVGVVREMLTQVGSTTAGLMFAYAMLNNYFPYELRVLLQQYFRKFLNLFDPYIHVTFPEYTSDGFFQSKSSAFSNIERYLNSTATATSKNLTATVARDSNAIILSMAKNEQVTDHFAGAKLWWASAESPRRDTNSISFYPQPDDKRHLRLTFHRRHRHLITSTYLRHVIAQGKAIALKERRRKIYTNNKPDDKVYTNPWSHVVFEHPATFETLAMDPIKKADVINDLTHFSKSKDYYAKVGKAWKRGYLLFGPPGTGKSTTIAAMANMLNYDIYDIELTSVKDNTALRKLLINTSGKSIIVIEDIDCSLDLTGQRKKEGGKDEEDDVDELKKKLKKKLEGGGGGNGANSSQVTLSGLLNFIDGLWSACGEERIIVFTTNYVDKLDPALIRRGRMDKHIELSYCGFEAFKVLAKNYLSVEGHDLFETIRDKLGETQMTPADVAENLTPKMGGEDAGSCLMRLVEALDEAKEKARIKAEEEEKRKVEKLAKEEDRKKKKMMKKKKKKAKINAKQEEKGEEDEEKAKAKNLDEEEDDEDYDDDDDDDEDYDDDDEYDDDEDDDDDE